MLCYWNLPMWAHIFLDHSFYFCECATKLLVIWIYIHKYTLKHFWLLKQSSLNILIHIVYIWKSFSLSLLSQDFGRELNPLTLKYPSLCNEWICSYESRMELAMYPWRTEKIVTQVIFLQDSFLTEPWLREVGHRREHISL